MHYGRRDFGRWPFRNWRLTTRLLALVNIALIPYVWWRFPHEARDYTRGSFRALLKGKADYER